MVLSKDTFLPAAFRRVQKIWKGLKSNGTSKKSGIFFLYRNRFTRLGKAGEDRACMSVSLLAFTPVSGPLLVGSLS